jgi:hypothetical protein
MSRTSTSGVAVYDVRLVRSLCETIAIEQNHQKAQDLLDRLRAAMRENDEEIALCLEFLKKKYAFVFKAAASSSS